MPKEEGIGKVAVVAFCGSVAARYGKLIPSVAGLASNLVEGIAGIVVLGLGWYFCSGYLRLAIMSAGVGFLVDAALRTIGQ